MTEDEGWAGEGVLTIGELTLLLSATFGEATSGVDVPVAPPAFLSFFCCFFPFSGFSGVPLGFGVSLPGVPGAGDALDVTAGGDVATLGGFAGVAAPLVEDWPVMGLGRLEVAEVGVPPTVAVRRYAKLKPMERISKKNGDAQAICLP